MKSSLEGNLDPAFEENLAEQLSYVEGEILRLYRLHGRYPDFAQTWSVVSGTLIRRLGRNFTQAEQKRIWNGTIDVFPKGASVGKRQA